MNLPIESTFQIIRISYFHVSYTKNDKCIIINHLFNFFAFVYLYFFVSYSLWKNNFQNAYSQPYIAFKITMLYMYPQIAHVKFYPFTLFSLHSLRENHFYAWYTYALHFNHLNWSQNCCDLLKSPVDDDISIFMNKH